MKFLYIAFIILLAHQVYLYPASSEESPETEVTEIEITNDNNGTSVTPKKADKDDMTVEEFVLASVLYDDDSDEDSTDEEDKNENNESKKSTKVKREAPKNADKVVAKRALVFRPLFVYKQQEIKRQRVQEQRKTTRRPVRTRPPTYGGNQPIG